MQRAASFIGRLLPVLRDPRVGALVAAVAHVRLVGEDQPEVGVVETGLGLVDATVKPPSTTYG